MGRAVTTDRVRYLVVFNPKVEGLLWQWLALEPDGSICPGCKSKAKESGGARTLCRKHLREHYALLAEVNRAHAGKRKVKAGKES